MITRVARIAVRRPIQVLAIWAELVGALAIIGILVRMREEYVRMQSNQQAVRFGIEKTGRIVTGAAAIMVGTFFAFALTR